MVWLILGVCIFIVVTMYACCVVAGKTDEMDGCK